MKIIIQSTGICYLQTYSISNDLFVHIFLLAFCFAEEDDSNYEVFGTFYVVLENPLHTQKM